MKQFPCLISLFAVLFLDSSVKAIMCGQGQRTNPPQPYGLGGQFTNIVCPNRTDACHRVEVTATAANGQSGKVW